VVVRAQQLAGELNYVGYLETRPGTTRYAQTDMRALFGQLIDGGAPAGSQVVADIGDVWQAIRRFFVHESARAAA
jgi:hypothetical protein